MRYAKTYNPCDDCQHSFSKNNQESNVCKICEFKQSQDLINRQKAEIEKLKEASEEAVSCFHRMESLYNIKRMELKVAKAEAIKVKEMVGDTE